MRAVFCPLKKKGRPFMDGENNDTVTQARVEGQQAAASDQAAQAQAMAARVDRGGSGGEGGDALSRARAD